MTAKTLQGALPGPWANIPLASGMTAASGNWAPQARVLPGGTVELCGAVNGSITNAVVIGTVTGQYVPGEQSAFTVTFASGAVNGQLVISTGGVMTVFVPSTQTQVHLDGIRYRLV
jgi:hypothetical protein